MLDHVDTGVDRPLDVEGLAIAGDPEAERMRFLDRGRDFGLREVARDLDDVCAVLEVLPNRVAPVVGTRGLAYAAVQGTVHAQAFGTVSTRPGDQLAGGEHAGSRNPA